MQKELSFSWNDTQVINRVFSTGSIYFFLTACYSLYNYQGKFLYDGAAQIFYITNYEWFPSAAQREIVYLQQVIPVLLANAALPVKWVMLGYVFNVYLLYYLLFFITAWLLKDALSAIFLILVHYQGDPLNYFVMVEELLPGACITVTLCSVLINFGSIKRKNAAIAGIALLILFIIRSHPLAFVCLAATVPLLYLIYPTFFKKHLIISVIMGVLALALLSLKFLFLNDYDVSRINEGKSVIRSAIDLLHPEKFSGMMLYLFNLRIVFAGAFATTVIFLIINHRYTNLMIFLIVFLSIVVLFNTMVDAEAFRTWNLGGMKYDQWSLPVRYVGFMAFCYMVLSEVRSVLLLKYVVSAFTFCFMVSAFHLWEQNDISRSYLSQVDRLIEQCRKSGISKAIVHANELLPGIPVHNTAYQDILVFSAMKQDSSVQVVYVDDEYSPAFDQMGDDEIILDKNQLVLHQSVLNPVYYRLPVEPYRNLVIAR